MFSLRKVLLVFCLLAPFLVLAQHNKQQDSSYRSIDTLVIQLDTLSIIPNTFTLTGIDSNDYHVDYLNGILYIDNPDLLGRKYQCHYQTFTFNLLKPKHHRTSSVIIHQQGSMYHQMSPIQSQTEDIFSNSGTSVQGTGSIARGVSIGTNQDFVLNSTLNLQLTGYLADKLEISANITDKNTPIQPEGNTQTISNFDQVYIRLNYDNRFMLNAGDVEMNFKNDAFLYAKRSFLGMEFNANNKIGSCNNMKNTVGGGVSKGKFIYATLSPLNGVQGPYRLMGENGETNITIVAGSESVYIDGQLLTRGEDQDYTIDYNTGELTFTVKQMITSEKRITVSYEYSDKSYARYNLYTFNEFTHEKNQKWKLNVNLFHEQDLKNQSLQPELDDEQKRFLSALPSGVETAWYPNANEVIYNPNEILYEKRDTVVNGISYSIYVHSTNADAHLYRVGFTLVGEQAGDYVLISSTSNGRVFQWVAPQNGVPQGNYTSAQQLRTPITHDMATVAAQYDFTKHTGFQTEIAISNYNANNFSSTNNNLVGMAYMLHFYHDKMLKYKKAVPHPWSFNTNLLYNFLSKDFRTIDDFRNVEFCRDYNVADVYATNTHEQMVQLDMGFKQSEIGQIQYKLNALSRFGEMNGIKNEFNANINTNSWKFNTITSYLFSNDSLMKSNFARTNTTLSKVFKHIELGATDIFEYNGRKDNMADSLLSGSFAFNEASIFLKNNDSLPYLFQISYKNRLDNGLKNSIMYLGTMSNEAKASLELAKLKNNRVKVNLTYRNTQIKNDEGTFDGENNFLGGVEYTGRFFRNAIVLNTYYEAGSGLEQKMAFSYLRVADGQGVYTWKDYNGNGIEELDEFEVAAYQDQANYIKVWQTSNEYINTFNNQFLQTIQLRPANVWSNKKDFRRILARFSNATTFKTVQKNTFNHNANAVNPFYLNMKDTNVVSSSLSFINTFSYNHKSLFGVDFIVQENQNKNMLYYGADYGRLQQQEVVLRGNPAKCLSLRASYQHSRKRNYSEFMTSRSYNIEKHWFEANGDFQFKNKYFVTLAYVFFNKWNQLDIQKAVEHKAVMELKFKILKKGNLIGNVSYIHLNYNDDENSSIAYEMLEGLGTGNNMTWGLKFEANITEFLQLNLLYEGRYTQGNKSIHTGSLEVRAHF